MGSGIAHTLLINMQGCTFLIPPPPREGAKILVIDWPGGKYDDLSRKTPI